MERDEFVQIIVRALGVFFAYQTIVSAYSLISQLLATVVLYSSNEDLGGRTLDIGQAFRIGMLSFVMLFVKVAATSFATYYCLWRGKLLHQLLISGPQVFRRQ